MKLKQAPETIPSGRGKHFAVVISAFNAPITDVLLVGCLDALKRAGAPTPHVVRVPGAFELPLVCLRLARSKKFDAVIALGCVIRGETPHDRYINHAVAQGLMRAGLDTDVPVIFGVLTPLNERQARARLSKGREAAEAALRMAAI